MASLLRFSNYIIEHANSHAEKVVDTVLSQMNITIPNWEREQAITMYDELFQFFGASLINKEERDKVPEALIEWSKKNSKMQLDSGKEIYEIVVRYPPTRDILHDMLTTISQELNLNIEEHSYLIKRINQLLDISLNETFFTFQRLSEEYKKETQQELLELSAPIVPVTNDIIILPLIGYIDQMKSEYIMNHVVPRIADLKVKYVIADYSGAATIQTENALFLNNIGKMLRLMGIHVIITGLRTESVQTIVNSGMDLAAVDSYATVKQALDLIK
ncbi:STAS domain-containing protein [Alteribacillus iranensis]|uniref:RsbT co-antagonist protein RsbR n=1 Tax=Alteribacillus iranensis TaxID=930128 RepID=A0A1I2EVA7_9BACI|nr:STAS domain-containing protein [Alteribacillus iranensis]SFE97022.1 rsbT co-antagonist protein RsbR [Alteribacillus iranensis]